MNTPRTPSAHSISAPDTTRGSAIIWFALLLPVLLGFAALAVDLAHVMVVRSELQNAADAAALAGAAKLTTPGGTAYNWQAAETEADSAVSLNKADRGKPLVKGVIESGWWNMQTATGLKANTETPGTYDKPAVKVTISRSSDADGLLNGGPLTLFFGRFLGRYATNVRAHAVAMISSPGYAETGSMFPFIIGKCMYDNYWDTATNAPKIDPATGKAYVFNFGSTYFTTCISGQWTTFNKKANDVPTVRDLIAHGNPIGYSLGDTIYIQNGVEDTLYRSIPIDTDILVAVIQGITPGQFEPIYAFAGMHIDNVVKIKGKSYIQGHFDSSYTAPGTGPGSGNGIDYGAYEPPILAH